MSNLLSAYSSACGYFPRNFGIHINILFVLKMINLFLIKLSYSLPPPSNTHKHTPIVLPIESRMVDKFEHKSQSYSTACLFYVGFGIHTKLHTIEI